MPVHHNHYPPVDDNDTAEFDDDVDPAGHVDNRAGFNLYDRARGVVFDLAAAAADIYRAARDDIADDRPRMPHDLPSPVDDNDDPPTGPGGGDNPATRPYWDFG